VLLKRKKFKKKQILLKLNFLKKELKFLIHKSLLKNHQNHYIFRLSFTINLFFFSKKNYFWGLNKLICPFTLSKKVPDKKYFFSRFFLNTQFESLNISNTYV
jgi:hypothetical protein